MFREVCEKLHSSERRHNRMNRIQEEDWMNPQGFWSQDDAFLKALLEADGEGGKKT